MWDKIYSSLYTDDKCVYNLKIKPKKGILQIMLSAPYSGSTVTQMKLFS